MFQFFQGKNNVEYSYFVSTSSHHWSSCFIHLQGPNFYPFILPPISLMTLGRGKIFINCHFYLFRSSASSFYSQYLLLFLKSSWNCVLLPTSFTSIIYFFKYDQSNWLFYVRYYLEVSSSVLYVQELLHCYYLWLLSNNNLENKIIFFIYGFFAKLGHGQHRGFYYLVEFVSTRGQSDIW